MRTRLLHLAALLALLPLIGASCGPTANRGPTGMPLVTSCVPREGDPLECKNMLYQGWNTAGLQPALSRLKLRLDQIKGDLQEAGANQLRVAGAECRLTAGAKTPRMVRVIYGAPKDLLRFPEAGTDGRDLVVGFMDSVEDKDNCWESRYGVVRQYDGWTRLFHFITVSTVAATVPTPGDPDVAFGTWKSWSLYSRQDPNDPSLTEFKLDTLRRGAYVRCGTPHVGPNDVAFIDCRTVHKLVDSATKVVNAGVVTSTSTNNGRAAAKPSVSFVFAGLLAKYKLGEMSLLRAFDSEGPSVESAWGRCGNLGCCASE